MVEGLVRNLSAQAADANLLGDDDLLSDLLGPGPATNQILETPKVAVPNVAAAMAQDMDNSYEETQMNPIGFFNEVNSEVSDNNQHLAFVYSPDLQIIDCS